MKVTEGSCWAEDGKELGCQLICEFWVSLMQRRAHLQCQMKETLRTTCQKLLGIIVA